ncbi:MAG TPA: hypothetical protein VH234_06260 [Candidatus Saccharimonadales bacterium]|jgi:cell division protein FtsX|nr:hypothetical protein [Candidatus Saccharimonadales bacterium]
MATKQINFDDAIKPVADEVKRLNNIMALVVIVLLIGFVLLLSTVAIEVVGTLKQDVSSREELIRLTQQLNDKTKP